MRRYILVLVLGFASASSAWATWADGLFEHLSRDFGSVPRGSILSHPFRIVNNTKGPIHIDNVRVSCGCVTAKALKQTLQPGEETAVVAQMDTSRFTFSRTVTIYVTFSQPSWTEVRLWVRADSREDVSVNPDNLAFGRIKRGDTPEVNTKISLLGNSNYRIKEVSCDSNYVQPSVKMVRSSDFEVEYSLTAKLRSDIPPGRWYTDVWVSTNNQSLPKVRIPLTVEVASTLSISPGTILMGHVKANSESVRKLIVRGVQPFKIVEIEGADQQLKVHSDSEEKREVHVLTVTLRPTQTGNIDRTLQIRTDLAEENTISFSARAFVDP